MLQTPQTNNTSVISNSPDAVEVQLLTAKDEFEVLTFLSQRPIHTVTMKSLIRDNGLVSPLNRGNFYGCRDVNGQLEGVMEIQAQLAFEESGVNPIETDPQGFRRRCLRRIRQGRTWVLFQKDHLVFKADVISETREVVYVEGIWVADHKRNDGLGTSCMSELSAKLLTSAKSLCLLTNELNTGALAFYRKCGFLFRATYETIFLSPQEALTA